LIGRTIRDDQFQTETDRIRLKYSADASNIVHAAMSRFKDIRGTVAQHLKDLDRLQSIVFLILLICEFTMNRGERERTAMVEHYSVFYCCRCCNGA